MGSDGSKIDSDSDSAVQVLLLTVGSDRLVGLVVKVSASRTVDLGSNPAFAVDLFPGRHTSDLNIGTPVATLPGAWR